MFDYTKYRPEDLAADRSFRSWKLDGDAEDARFWTEWIELHPHKQNDVAKAELLLEAVGDTFDQITEFEIRDELHRLAQRLDEPSAETNSREVSLWPGRSRWIWAAASLIGVVSLAWWLTQSTPAGPIALTYAELVENAEDQLVEYVNTDKLPHTLALPDESTIVLQPGSKVSYQKEFAGDQRVVYLAGEGFFDVVKNPAKPFFVYANTVVTKVLGTSFAVKASPGGDQVQVEVVTGRVSVFKNNGRALSERTKAPETGNEIILKPNQKLVFLADENQFSRSLVAQPEVLESTPQQLTFTFKATPIEDVFGALEKAYGIEIVYDKELMKNCYLTGSFADEPLFEKLDLITRTISANYQQIDGQIVISSHGC
ncbi:FecR family protein [Persicitalea jodogahamensis]|uniref:FecR family protein n=1 Tax=Persicitalea jodogahamensis TaxID=402147 RepID=A0A8J3G8V0_9BACT|nr:FecR family protein [Persicitalea jodogahamensis]GHB68384.1 hypothetical protein GCM10007390_22180 [Persicitalea jodogahamensis]